METTDTERAEVIDVSPDLLGRWLTDGGTVVVDVREDFEHAEERIDGAELAPLSTFDPAAIRREHGDARVVFQCRTGRRSRDAAERYRQEFGEQVFHLAGGIEAWKTAGQPTTRPEAAPRIGVMRQVQMTAGFLVALGVILGLMVSPWFLGLSAFVGCGLMFAGATGWCGMAMLLGRMPWNRTAVGA
ncbi:MAG: rhodanese-like domain-containing protein [Planctomycetota bacterium]